MPRLMSTENGSRKVLNTITEVQCDASEPDHIEDVVDVARNWYMIFVREKTEITYVCCHSGILQVRHCGHSKLADG